LRALGPAKVLILPRQDQVDSTPVYIGKVKRILTNDEREAFAVFIAQNPRAGSVVRGSGGI